MSPTSSASKKSPCKPFREKMSLISTQMAEKHFHMLKLKINPNPLYKNCFERKAKVHLLMAQYQDYLVVCRMVLDKRLLASFLWSIWSNSDKLRLP